MYVQKVLGINKMYSCGYMQCNSYQSPTYLVLEQNLTSELTHRRNEMVRQPISVELVDTPTPSFKDSLGNRKFRGYFPYSQSIVLFNTPRATIAIGSRSNCSRNKDTSFKLPVYLFTTTWGFFPIARVPGVLLLSINRMCHLPNQVKNMLLQE